MILEKLKILFFMLVFFLMSSALVSFADDQNLEKIKEMQALIEYERKSIKNLLIDLKEKKNDTQAHAKLKVLIEGKHKDLNEKTKKLNELINAVSYSSKEVKKDQVKKTQTLNELEDEIGIDRDISSIHKKINKVYKDFRATKANKDWQQKKDTHFKLKERKKKIIMVE